MSNTEKKQAIALNSVFASLGLTAFKAVVGVLTGSIGIISEALHSALDLGAALLTFFAVRISDKPADDKHHYGHGKVESVSALIETGLLFLTSFWIIYESVHRLISDSVEIEATWYAFLVMIISVLVDISRSRALYKVAKETNSQALEADALHFKSDIYSSAVVIFGLILVSLGIKSADAYAAIGVSIFVAHAGYSLGKRTIDVLTDAAPEGIKSQIIESTKKIEGIIDIEKVRVRVVGPDSFVDITAFISRKLAITKAHAISNSITAAIQNSIPKSDITVHLKPLPLDSETIMERVKITAQTHGLHIHDIHFHFQKNRKYLSYILEVQKDLTLKKAHELATELEQAIQTEIGEDVEIDTHLEPESKEEVINKEILPQEKEQIQNTITALTKNIKKIQNIHNLKIRKNRKNLFISFHCSFQENLTVQETHQVANDLEQAIKKAIPTAYQVVIHTEPDYQNEHKCHLAVK